MKKVDKSKKLRVKPQSASSSLIIVMYLKNHNVTE